MTRWQPLYIGSAKHSFCSLETSQTPTALPSGSTAFLTRGVAFSPSTMDPGSEPALDALLPELTTTVLPSNGQLMAIETEELVAASLSAMRANLSKKPAWRLAPEATDDMLLMFLRSEVFHPHKAADRYRKFWKTKIVLCGEDKAALPIKVEDARGGLDLEFCQIVPGSKDREGRQVVVVNTGQANKSLDRKLRVRAVWYILLAALEDVETQRRGFCFVVSLKTARISQLDQKFNKMVLDSIQGTLPVRVGSMNMCYPPSFFKVIWMVISTFLHERVRQRFRFIYGTDQDVLQALEPTVAPHNLPPPMGQKPLDFQGWLSERIKTEV
ncbi:unnamed protein product [Scytosiphon promiscuus]